MAAITTRQTAGIGATVAGGPLTNAQIDNNFININLDLPQKFTVSDGQAAGVSIYHGIILDTGTTWTTDHVGKIEYRLISYGQGGGSSGTSLDHEIGGYISYYRYTGGGDEVGSAVIDKTHRVYTPLAAAVYIVKIKSNGNLGIAFDFGLNSFSRLYITRLVSVLTNVGSANWSIHSRYFTSADLTTALNNTTNFFYVDYANTINSILYTTSSLPAANITGTISGDRGVTAGSSSVSFIEYNGITKTAGQFDGGTTAPTNTTRLNYDGNLYATNFFGSGSNLTSLTAGNLSGTIPSAVLGNSSVFIGTTSVVLNRATGVLALTGVSIDGNAGTVTGGVYTSGDQSIAGVKTLTGPLVSPRVNIERVNNTASGISWYNRATYTSWADYMAQAAQTSVGPTGNITAPTGTLVTSWGLRRFIENAAGYGWTFESGTSAQTTPTIVAEIRSSDGAARFGGVVTAPNFADSTGTYNINLGSGGSEGRGVGAGYSGGSYGGIGYNIRHTASSDSYIAPGSDTVSYLRFDTGGFRFFGSAAGAAGRSISLTTGNSIAFLSSAGNLSISGNITATGTLVGDFVVSVINTNTTALHGTVYILTSSLTLTLPASPSVGDWIRVANRSGTTTAVIARNGQNIMSLAEDMTVDTLNATLTLVYASATLGWTLI